MIELNLYFKDTHIHIFRNVHKLLSRHNRYNFCYVKKIIFLINSTRDKQIFDFISFNSLETEVIFFNNESEIQVGFF